MRIRSYTRVLRFGKQGETQMKHKNFSASSDEQLANYFHEVFKPEDAILSEIRNSIAKEGLPPIQLTAADGRHLQVLASLTRPKTIVEIGTLAGYSTVFLARALTDHLEARVFTFERDEKHARIARLNLERAGLNKKVTVIEGPALERLSEIEAYKPFDVVFIDADKVNYKSYFEWASPRVRVGGVVIADNTLAFGKIAAEHIESHDRDRKSVMALREYNLWVAGQKNFLSTLLPTGEGLTVSVRLS